MNYTIIAHKARNNHTNRCGDFVRDEGKFEVFHSTYAADAARVLGQWRFENEFDEFVVCLDGMPDNQVTFEGEYEDEYDAFEKEADDQYAVAKEKARLKNEKEAADKKAEWERLQKISADAQKATELAQYHALKARLGL
jgi:hypothetical protein